jgi:hypothetical protein
MLAIQYLEDSPHLAQLDVSQVVDKLRLAAERLQFTHLLVGWHLPPSLLEACRMEADRLGLVFLRWQPLLTTDRVFQPDSTWRTEGLTGHKVRGYRDIPEFTFVCSNHPAVQEAALTHMEDLVHQGLYQGFFLDRVRFPSPAVDPINDLTCFCEHCRHKASGDGLDLQQIRTEILRSTLQESGRIALIKELLSGRSNISQNGSSTGISQWLEFRKKSVVNFLTMISQPLRKANLEVGLDCYTPSLTHMVGQDLRSMSKLVDWIKLMTYTHTLGPAGIPFELSGLLHYLTTTTNLRERQAILFLSQSIGLTLPANRLSLEENGLATDALETEVKRGVKVCSCPVLAGIELVELEGVTRLKPDQIRADLIGVKRAGPAGLTISWDLLHIPLDRLDLVRLAYFGNK